MNQYQKNNNTSYSSASSQKFYTPKKIFERFPFKFFTRISSSSISERDKSLYFMLRNKLQNLHLLYEQPAITGSIKEEITKILRDNFRPEFLNRIDEILTFNRLEKEHIRKIVDI